MKLVVFERRLAPDPRSDPHSMGAAALGFETLEAVTQGQRRLGAWVEAGAHADTVVDLNRALAVKLAGDDAGAPEAEADSLLPADMGPFLRRLPDSLRAARSALDFVADALDRYDAPDLESAGVALPRRAVRMAAPVRRPGKLIGRSRDADGGDPALFLIAPSAVSGPEDDVALLDGVPLSFRPEIAAIVGRRARRLAPEDALACVAGYCAALTFRAEGPDAPAGTVGHSGDGFVPLGPALVSVDDAPDPHDLRLELRLSGRRLETIHTKELAWPLHELVSRASQWMTLEPGDVVLSGAPPATGELPTLRDGDVVEVEAERLGRLAVYLRAPYETGV
ncbi:MAG: fumarylacetoacetate hydrolase family protein [Myxococcota bacterium]